MRLNSVLKTCSRTCASFEREPNEASLALDTGAGVRHTPSPEPVRDSGPVRGKSSDGGAGLPIAEVTEVSGKVVIRGVSKSGRKQGWREVQSLSNKHTQTHTLLPSLTKDQHNVIPLEKETLVCVQEMPRERRCSVEKRTADLFHCITTFTSNTIT